MPAIGSSRHRPPPQCQGWHKSRLRSLCPTPPMGSSGCRPGIGMLRRSRPSARADLRSAAAAAYSPKRSRSGQAHPGPTARPSPLTRCRPTSSRYGSHRRGRATGHPSQPAPHGQSRTNGQSAQPARECSRPSRTSSSEPLPACLAGRPLSEHLFSDQPRSPVSHTRVENHLARSSGGDMMIDRIHHRQEIDTEIGKRFGRMESASG